MIRQAPLSCKTLKEKLLKCLTDVRIDDSAHRYCGLIVKAKQVIDPSLNIPSINLCENINTADMITDRIRNLIAGDKPEFNVAERIVTRFKNVIRFCVFDREHDFSDKPERLLKLLSEINDSHTLKVKYGNSENYIKYLITATDRLLSAYGGDKSIFEHPRHSSDLALNNLICISDSVVSRSGYNAENILSLVYRLGRARSDFAEKEKREIGYLMIGAFEPIKTCIKEVNCFSNNTLSILLRKRSALQFLVDDYATFPAGNGTLLRSFYEDKINDSVKHIDNIIRVWCDYLGDGVVDEKEVGDRVLDNDMTKWYEDEKDLEKAGASEMPESHRWWADSIKKCITEASQSRKPFKEQLVRCLKDVSEDGNAHCFLGLVLDANEIIEPDKSNPSLKCFGYNTLRANMVIRQLRNLISGDKPEYIKAKHLVARVEHSISLRYLKEQMSDKSERILQVLLEIDDSESLKLKYRNSEDYLKQLITAMDYSDCTPSSFHLAFPFKDTEDKLQHMQSCIDFKYNVGDLLSIIFQIGQASSDLSEKKEVGVFLMDALGPIKDTMLSVNCFSEYSLGFLLQRRSALQFLVDDYATFPVGNGALLKDFYGNKLSDSMKHIDKIIKTWCDYKCERVYDERIAQGYANDMDYYSFTDESEVKEAGATRVPETHTWWPESIKKCITDQTHAVIVGP